MSVRPGARHSSGQVLPFRESLLATLGLSFVLMLVALDQTVVGTALPTIVAELHGFSLYAWVATSYLLTSVITVPIFGRLGDYYGRKPFVVASIVVFVVASGLCGAAHSMPFLVFARGLQGIGGGMLVGTVFACVPDLFPDAVVRLRWQIMMSTAFGVANAIGPSLGGFLTQYYGWRSVFYVNLPIGLLSLVFAWRYLPHVRQIEHGRRIQLDWQGALLIAVALGSLQMLVESVPKDGITLGTVTQLVLGVGASYALWRWEQRCPQPILPPAMFRNRSASALFWLSVLGGFSMFSLLFYAPLLFQGGFGVSPQDAGLLITPLVVFVTVGSITNGRIVSRIPNPNRMLQVGFAMIAAACVVVAVATRSMPHALLMSFMVVGGLGLGFVMPNLTVFTQQVVEREHLGIATALLQSLRMIGGMFGTALTGTLVSHMYASTVRRVLDDAHASNWYAQLADPQILINRTAQADLIGRLVAAGHDGPALLDAARVGLVEAIHLGIAIAALVAIVAIWRSLFVPPIKLRRAVDPAPVVAGD